MLISRRSPLTGEVNTLDLPVTEAQMIEWESWPRRLIQDIFPNLTPAEREFIKLGYTAADWENLFPPGWADSPQERDDDDDERTD